MRPRSFVNLNEPKHAVRGVGHLQRLPMSQVSFFGKQMVLVDT